jgi:hypothetical protein
MVMSDVSEARVEWLTVVGQPDAWRSIGLTVTEEGLIPLIGTSLRVVRPGGEGVHASASGIVGWVLSGVAEPIDAIDGLVTDIAEPGRPTWADHELGVSGLDHVVVLTDDLERTAAAITRVTDSELKRIRAVGTMRQGFHRIGRGGLIVELVERPEVADGAATFWGLVINVADLDRACGRLGSERIGAPNDAVQPGRRIATLRESVGLGIPVALMTR